MMNVINIMILLFVLTFLNGCGFDNLSPNKSELECKKHVMAIESSPQIAVEDNCIQTNTFKILKEKKYVINQVKRLKKDISYTIKIIPNELFLIEKGVNSSEMEKALQEINKETICYFEFESISKRDLIKQHLSGNLDEAISYLSSGIINDFYMINMNNDTVRPLFVHFERNFHVAPFERILLSFPDSHQNEITEFFYDDKIFGNGLMNFPLTQDLFTSNY